MNSLELLRDYSKRDAVWDKHKNDAMKLADFLSDDAEFEKCCVRLRATAQDLGFAWVDNIETGESVIKLKQAWFSRWRHDPVSNWRKTMKWRARWFEALPRIFTEYPTHRWIFVTLTVENCRVTDLKAACQHLNKSFSKMVRTGKLARHFHIKKGMTSNAGYYKALEVTKEKDRDGYAHPHLHVLFHVPADYFTRNYITQAEWTEMWQKAAGLDYQPMIDVRAVKAKKTALNATNESGLPDAVLEVTKYPNKAADLLVCPAWTKSYIRQMNRVRLIDVAGTLKKFIKDEKDDDDLIKVNDEKEDENDLENDDFSRMIFFAFNNEKKVKKYVKKSPVFTSLDN
jgi:plasmid rolling circle replication initiator protein Rep